MKPIIREMTVRIQILLARKRAEESNTRDSASIFPPRCTHPSKLLGQSPAQQTRAQRGLCPLHSACSHRVKHSLGSHTHNQVPQGQRAPLAPRNVGRPCWGETFWLLPTARGQSAVNSLRGASLEETPVPGAFMRKPALHQAVGDTFTAPGCR